ncbi:MAG: aldehyde dehydrogenase family protein [Candidatus Aminicenantes bacterium]|nr:aldehyde dehydrogenase family protein [Candidatus Aminicenantes bacterium]
MDKRLLINNHKIETPETIESINPATLEPVGEVCLASSEECRGAVEAAKSAFPGWRDISIKEKKNIFRQAKKILLHRSEDVARLITEEKGSPLPESLSGEVMGILEALDYHIQTLDQSLRPLKMKHYMSFFYHKGGSFHFQPLGVTLVISPWNFPFFLPACDVLSALASGNTVVFRPSTSTPLIGLLAGEIFVEAGLPPGVMNVVNCWTSQAEELILNPKVQTIMFTGSVPTGKRIMELASRNMSNIVLELGGKDPMIVLKDADLERASRGAVWGAFMNCGQSCASVERLYVDREVAEEFCQKVVDLTKNIKVGNPLDPGVDMGPLANPSQLKTVEEHIQEAKEKGAQILWGGEKIETLPGYFLQPTVLTGVDHSMKIMQEETFGPALPIMTFSDPEEAVSLANDSIYGLTASVWTKNKKMASRLADRIETGTVTVNDHMSSAIEPAALWGGIKQTGIGRSHGIFGLRDLTNIKFVSLDFSRKKNLMWWYPYSVSWQKLLEKALVLFYHDRLKEKAKAILALLAHFMRIKEGSPLLNYIKSLPRFLRK